MEYTIPAYEFVSNTTGETTIPVKSRKIYDCAYKRFMNWAQENNACYYTEEVMLEYFTHLAQTLKCSTLWAQYSMVKAGLNIKHNVNIENYTKVLLYLKQQSDGYKPRRSQVLTVEQFDNFLQNAPNKTHLATKVILLFGITGGCRCDELLAINVNDVEDLGKVVAVKIRNSKTKKLRSFNIWDRNYINIYREYAALRPKTISITRFFVKYQNGSCHRAVIGIHKIANVPKEVATYLNLPNPSQYTGHCLRRTAQTLRLINGLDISSLKAHGEGHGSQDDSEKSSSEDEEEPLTKRKPPATNDYNEFADNGDTSTSTAMNYNTPDAATVSSGLNCLDIPIGIMKNCDFSDVPVKVESLSEPASPLTIEEVQINVAGIPLLPETDETRNLSTKELKRLVLLEQLQVLRLKKAKLLREQQR